VRDPSEDERRVYYVGMTRAQETLCLLDRRDVRNPFAESLSGDFVFRRELSASVGRRRRHSQPPL